MSATAEVRASRLVSSRRARFVARTVLALALALDVRALTRGPVPAQEFAALVRVVKDAQRRFSAQPDANPRCDFKGWLKKNRKRPESAWGDPSRHKSETLREFVRELGEEATTRACADWSSTTSGGRNAMSGTRGGRRKRLTRRVMEDGRWCDERVDTSRSRSRIISCRRTSRRGEGQSIGRRDGAWKKG